MSRALVFITAGMPPDFGDEVEDHASVSVPAATDVYVDIKPT